MTTPAIRFIRYALSIDAFEFPPEGFILKGKRLSPYLFNSSVFCTGESLGVLARAYATAIAGYFCPDIVFAAENKFIPIATVLAQILGGNVGIAFRGESEKIIGATLKDKNVLVIDQAMTTGDTLREAREFVLSASGKSIGCAIAFDRQEMGSNGSQSAIQEFKESFGIVVRSIATLDDLIKALKKGPDLEKIVAYRQQFGAV